jgi:hypothetical protein
LPLAAAALQDTPERQLAREALGALEAAQEALDALEAAVRAGGAVALECSERTPRPCRLK